MINKYKNVTAEFQEIDATIASEFLKKNKSNRRIDKNRLEKYVQDIKQGYWCMNGDAIRFDESGNLIDGQHRLTAIEKTKTKQVFLVIKNVQHESKRTIDTGKSRTGADILSMFSNVGARDSGVIASAIKKLIQYDLGVSLSDGGGNLKYTTNSAIEEYYKNHYLEISQSLELINSIIDNHAMIISRADTLFLHVIFSRIDKAEADIFIRKIITGVNVEENSNEKLIRAILTKRAMKTIKIPAYEVLYTCIKAWNRNRKGGVYSTESNIRYRPTDGGYPLAN